MTQFEIAKLACRVIAVYLFGIGIIYLGSFLGEVGAMILSLSRVRGMNLAVLLGGSGFIAVCYGGVGALLWNLSGNLAGRIAGDSTGPITGVPDAGRAMLPLAFTAVGAFAFITVAGAFAGDIAYAMQPTSSRYSGSAFWTPRLWSHGVELALSLWFIFGSRGIAAVVHWVRTAGDKSRPPADGPMTCSRCGYNLLEGMARCPECGGEVAGTAAAHPGE
jgi:hypothetical protein